ncbi:MAG: hypothetical protein V1707_00950 [bacterium]
MPNEHTVMELEKPSVFIVANHVYTEEKLAKAIEKSTKYILSANRELPDALQTPTITIEVLYHDIALTCFNSSSFGPLVNAVTIMLYDEITNFETEEYAVWISEQIVFNPVRTTHFIWKWLHVTALPAEKILVFKLTPDDSISLVVSWNNYGLCFQWKHLLDPDSPPFAETLPLAYKKMTQLAEAIAAHLHLKNNS